MRKQTYAYRLKRKYRSARAAWASVAAATGWKPSQVVPRHNERCWRWVLKSSLPRKRRA